LKRLGFAAAALALAGCGGGGSHGLGPGDVRQLEQLAVGRAGGQVLTVAWSPNGKRIAAGGPNGIVIVDPQSGRSHLLLHTATQVWGVAWDRDGTKLAAATEDGKVWISPLHVYQPGRNVAPAFSVDWSPDGKLAIGYGGGTVRVIARDGNDHTYTSHTAEVIAVAWSHAGDRLASGSIDATVRIGDGHRERFGEPSGADVNGVAWSPDDEKLAAANQDGIVRVWDVGDRKIVLRLRGHEGWTRGVAWSPNGKLLLTSGADGTARLWDAESGKELRSVKAGASEAWAVAWSPDGQRFATGDGDGSVRIWGVR
jgi:WD40 repeat protein